MAMWAGCGAAVTPSVDWALVLTAQTWAEPLVCCLAPPRGPCPSPGQTRPHQQVHGGAPVLGFGCWSPLAFPGRAGPRRKVRCLPRCPAVTPCSTGAPGSAPGVTACSLSAQGPSELPHPASLLSPVGPTPAGAECAEEFPVLVAAVGNTVLGVNAAVPRPPASLKPAFFAQRWRWAGVRPLTDT